MAITVITFQDILDPSLAAPLPYLDFRSRYCAFVFQSPTNVTLLDINNYSVTDSNFTLLPSTAYLADPLDATKSLLKWSNLNVTWQIPTGTIPYLAKYTFLTNTYYVVFGVFTGDGGIDTSVGCGTDVTVRINPGTESEAIFTNCRLEAWPYRQPCDTVRNYYNTTGLITVSL